MSKFAINLDFLHRKKKKERSRYSTGISDSENAKIPDPAVHEDSKWEIRTAKMQKYQIPVAQRGIAQIKQIQVYTCENTFVKWVKRKNRNPCN